jgi:hypothetical protein
MTAAGKRVTAASAKKSATGKIYDYYQCYRCHAVKSLPTAKAAPEFVELLKRLRPDQLFTEEFATILKQEWTRSTGDAAAEVGKLNTDLKEKRKVQESYS